MRESGHWDDTSECLAVNNIKLRRVTERWRGERGKTYTRLNARTPAYILPNLT